jgi:hypothetical protein
MSASVPQDPRKRTGAAIPSSEDHPASPGPDPDDINRTEDDAARDHRDGAPHTPAVSPTSPGPNPDDVDDQT